MPRDFTISDERYLRKMDSAFARQAVAESAYRDAIERLEHLSEAFARVTAERDRARRGVRCGVWVSGVLLVLAAAGWGLWLFR